MIDLAGYRVTELVHTGSVSTVYRGFRLDDGKPVVIKKYEGAEVEREYSVVRSLSGPGIPNLVSFDRTDSRSFLVYEDTGGLALDTARSAAQFGPDNRCEISLSLVDIIFSIHEQGYLYTAFHPSRIIYCPDTGVIHLAGLGHAVSAESMKVPLTERPSGRIECISPEQTGRIQKIPDMRSDLYSLGCCLYWLWTGHYPFTGDTLEILYSHIARVPLAPALVEGIPGELSAIIMKLLSKRSEDRYQTAAGLRSDLQYALSTNRGTVPPEAFVAGASDRNPYMLHPSRIYGRKDEYERMTGILCAKRNTPVCILVSGASGIGKTSLIQEAVRPCVEEGAVLVTGTFSLLERNIPFSILSAVLSDLYRAVLQKDGESEPFRTELLAALDTNAGILTHLVPDLVALLGEHEEPPTLFPTEAWKRLVLVVGDFVRMCADRLPLVVFFLDDVQWADMSSMDLLGQLLFSKASPNVRLILSYRDCDILSGHPVSLFLEDIHKGGGFGPDIQEFEIGPLPEADVNILVAGTLQVSTEMATSLSHYIYTKTKGNPFFSLRLLQSLSERGLLTNGGSPGDWSWKMVEIERAPVSDDVVDFLVDEMAALPEAVQSVLSKAACIGQRFDFHALSHFCERSDGLPGIVWLLLERGYILPLTSAYRRLDSAKTAYAGSGVEMLFRFAHDRIHTAAYSLMSSQTREQTHRLIGMKLLASRVRSTPGQMQIFELTNQLNLAGQTISLFDDRLELMRLNTEAARKAAENTAYDVALTYVDRAISLLSPQEWEDYPSDMYCLRTLRVECLFHRHGTEDALNECSVLVTLAGSKLEQADVFALRAKILDHGGERREFIMDELRKALALFDVSFPYEPERLSELAAASLVRMRDRFLEMGESATNIITSLPPMNNPENERVMRLLYQALPVAFQYNQDLYLSIQARMFSITLDYGICDVSCKNLVECGMSLGSIFGMYREGHACGKIAFDLIDRYRYREQKSACCFIFATFISHWSAPFSESLEYFDLSIKSGLELGDIQHAAYAATHRFNRLVYTSLPLSEASRTLEELKVFLESVQGNLLLVYAEYLRYFIDRLTGRADISRESDLAAVAASDDNVFYRCVFGQLNVFYSVVMGDLEAAAQWVAYTEPFLNSGIGMFPLADHVLFRLLTVLRQERAKKTELTEGERKIVETSLAQLELWAENSSENFYPVYWFALAEYRASEGRAPSEVLEAYRKALEGIRPGSFEYIRAMVLEGEGLYRSMTGDVAGFHSSIRSSCAAFRLWGATEKVSLMERQYPFVQDRPAIRLSQGEVSEGGPILFERTLSAVQVLARDLKRDSVIAAALRLVCELLDMDRGVFLAPIPGTAQFSAVAGCERNMEGYVVVHEGDPHERSRIACNRDVVRHVHNSGDLVLLHCASEVRSRFSPVTEGLPEALVCASVKSQNLQFGVLYLDSLRTREGFDSALRASLVCILEQLGVSLEHAHRFDDLEGRLCLRNEQVASLQRENSELSLVDPVTGLYNRRYLDEVVKETCEKHMQAYSSVQWSREKRRGFLGRYVTGVVLVRLDSWSRVHAVYGQTASSQLMSRFTDQLRALVRKNDVLIKWGSDDILVLLTNATRRFIPRFVDKVLSACANGEVDLGDNRKFRLDCGVGSCSFPLYAGQSDRFSLDSAITLCSVVRNSISRRTGSQAACATGRRFRDDGIALERWLDRLEADSDFDDRFITVDYRGSSRAVSGNA